jgi:enoyl-CoA hydratase
MDLASYTQIQLSRRGKVLIAALNRPDARNAITPELDLELLRLFYDLDTDPDSNVMVLTGNGRSFSAGGDIVGMQAGLDDISSFTVGYKNGKRILQMMLDCEKPIICRMNGDAIGLGATLALFSDIIIANEDARIGDPHVRVGLVAGDGGAVIWPQLIGYARAKQYLLSGDLLTAREAQAIGLINFAVPMAELDAKVDEWADKLANGAQQAIRWTKTVVNIGLKQLLVSMVDAGFALETVSSRLPDHAEAVNAFLAKRKLDVTKR